MVTENCTAGEELVFFCLRKIMMCWLPIVLLTIYVVGFECWLVVSHVTKPVTLFCVCKHDVHIFGDGAIIQC